MLVGLVLKPSFLVPLHEEDDNMAKFSKKIYRNAWSSNSLLYGERLKLN